jgi:hypothetical protein
MLIKIIYNLRKLILILVPTALFLFSSCASKSKPPEPAPQKENQLSSIDTIFLLLKNRKEITKEQLLSLHIIDSTYSLRASDFNYCDTTVQLNENIFYTILNVSDSVGVCSQGFIITFDERNKEAIRSAPLTKECDVDFAMDRYDLESYKVKAKDSIKWTRTTIHQKKNRTSDDEEENIESEDLSTKYITISPEGYIKIPAIVTTSHKKYK